MKNIHILPTEKPSYFFISSETNEICRYFKKMDSKSNKVHIYITSDEKIKEGDYNVPSDFSKFSDISKTSKEDLQVVNEKSNGYKKIILTTDQDLIKDGVQSIDDEFLEWFVKNPSCEEVDIDVDLKYFNVDELRERYLKGLPYIYSEKIGYKIIIPQEEPKHPKVFSENGNGLFFDEEGKLIKEEPKQLFNRGDKVLFTGKILNEEVIDKLVTVIYTLGRGSAEDMSDIMDEYTHVYRVWNKDLKHIPTEETYDRTYQPIILSDIDKEEPTQEFDLKELNRIDDLEIEEMSNDWKTMKQQVKPKQETLEEAAFRLYPRLINDTYNPMEDDNKDWRDEFIKGAKWQEQRMYSEEEVIELIQTFNDICNLTNKPHQIKNFFQQFKKK